MERITNAEFKAKDKEFFNACVAYFEKFFKGKKKPHEEFAERKDYTVDDFLTNRQASKFRNGKGRVFKFWRFNKNN